MLFKGLRGFLVQQEMLKKVNEIKKELSEKIHRKQARQVGPHLLQGVGEHAREYCAQVLPDHLGSYQEDDKR